MLDGDQDRARMLADELRQLDEAPALGLVRGKVCSHDALGSQSCQSKSLQPRTLGEESTGMRWLLATALLGPAMLAVSCLDDSDVQHGILDWGEGVSVQVPAQATGGRRSRSVQRRGEAASRLRERTSPTSTDVNDDIAIVEPFDRSPAGCKLLKLCAAYHQAQLSFDTPGKKIIVVRGRSRIRAGDPPQYQEAFQLVDVQTSVLVE